MDLPWPCDLYAQGGSLLILQLMGRPPLAAQRTETVCDGARSPNVGASVTLRARARVGHRGRFAVRTPVADTERVSRRCVRGHRAFRCAAIMQFQRGQTSRGRLGQLDVFAIGVTTARAEVPPTHSFSRVEPVHPAVQRLSYVEAAGMRGKRGLRRKTTRNTTGSFERAAPSRFSATTTRHPAPSACTSPWWTPLFVRTDDHPRSTDSTTSSHRVPDLSARRISRRR